jgi:hypothetical protein
MCAKVTATGNNVVSSASPATRRRRRRAATPAPAPASTQDPLSDHDSRHSTAEPDTAPEEEGADNEPALLKVGTCPASTVWPCSPRNQRTSSFRGHNDEVASPNKRIRVSNASAMMEMTKVVGLLVTAAGAPPSSPSPSLPAALDASPVRRDRAFRRIVDKEDLTPTRLLKARRIFRGRTELADEYLSFGETDIEIQTRRGWLLEELVAVAPTRAVM